MSVARQTRHARRHRPIWAKNEVMLIRRLDDCPEFTAGDMTRLRELLHPDRQPVAIRYSLAHALLETGAASLPHILVSAEVYYILSGRGIMAIDGEQCAVEPGQAVYIPPGAEQWLRNIAQEPLVFLCIVDPAWQRADETVTADPIQSCQAGTCGRPESHAEKNT